ncbi:MAG: phosphoenolpyruvate--protein phosphotransferase [Lentisphaerae bacterium]|nr:phosphoenolpyruvate--protein phosphotransferase [Lentisphaerota bacterium]
MPGSHKKNTKSKTLKGIGVSPGVVIGPVFLLTRETLRVMERTLVGNDIQNEIIRFERALIETRRQIKVLQEEMEKRAPGSGEMILEAHLLVLDDRAFSGEILKRIRQEHRNAEPIISEVAENYANILGSVNDAYLRERVSDLRDVARRVVRNLVGGVGPSLSELARKHIIVATDLVPSETASMRKDMVMGFATDTGSPTSHTAVMARAFEIPAIVGLHNATEQVETGDEVLIDGNKGIFIIRPTPEDLERYGRVAKARKDIEDELTTLKDQPAETTDKHRIVLSANMETTEEIDTVIQYGSEGVGLFRSEFLYLSRDEIVSEQEQAQVYSEVAERLSPNPVIVRTLDLGGDKFMDGGLAELREPNPFLGCRSIRFMLQNPDHFKSQLRAILRASIHGNVKIMYPMITNALEIDQANELLEEAKEDLTRLNVKYDADIDVGVMIEIPSAALMADTLAEKVDFFSVGTNDLVQYTLAVDRINERVAYLYQPAHPAVLRLIKETIDAGHRKNIWVGLCGEMAADPLLAPLLVGMGIDELSVAPSAVPMIKDAIRRVDYIRLQNLATIALSCKSADEILRHCHNLTSEVAPELLELV